MRRTRHLFPSLAVAATVVGGVLLAPGCTPRPRATVRLLQPTAPPMQQNIKLAANWSYTSAAGARRECLLDFPLPHAQNGPRDFRLYLSLAATDQPQGIDATDPEGARGFLIQVVGERRGKTEFTGGTVRLRPVPLDRRRFRLEIDATCEDGAQVMGTATVVEDEDELRAFKRRYALDIAALESSVAVAADEEPASSPDETPAADTASRGDEAPPNEAGRPDRSAAAPGS